MFKSIALIGECMLELSSKAEDNQNSALGMILNYGGDTINTAVYLARAGINVSYITALGDDTMSDWLIEQWTEEQIDCSLVRRQDNSVPGMYMINVDDQGERSFLYWRKDSPASRLFDDAALTDQLFTQVSKFGYAYLSGISLAILNDQARQRLISALRAYKEGGGKIIFDGNYRPKLWQDTTTAKQAYLALYAMSDIVLPTLEDEQQLFGVSSAEEVLQMLIQLGVKEAVIKMGGSGCLSYFDERSELVSSEKVTPIDTTAAGDSFNAGYLAARIRETSTLDACIAGHKLAAQVIQYKGAILPK